MPPILALPTARVQGACTSPYLQHRGCAYPPSPMVQAAYPRIPRIPITQSSPWRMPLILTLPHYHKRRACPHLFTIKLHAHNLQSTSATVHALHFHCLPRRTHDASPHPPHIAKVHASHPLSINTDMSALYPPRRMPLILIQSWSTPVLIFTQFLRLSRCTTVAGATVTVCKL